VRGAGIASGRQRSAFAVKGVGLQRVQSHSGTGSLHPVALEAAAELTKPAEAFDGKGRNVDLASVQGRNVSER